MLQLFHREGGGKLCDAAMILAGIDIGGTFDRVRLKSQLRERLLDLGLVGSRIGQNSRRHISANAADTVLIGNFHAFRSNRMALCRFAAA